MQASWGLPFPQREKGPKFQGAKKNLKRKDSSKRHQSTFGSPNLPSAHLESGCLDLPSTRHTRPSPSVALWPFAAFCASTLARFRPHLPFPSPSLPFPAPFLVPSSLAQPRRFFRSPPHPSLRFIFRALLVSPFVRCALFCKAKALQSQEKTPRVVDGCGGLDDSQTSRRIDEVCRSAKASCRRRACAPQAPCTVDCGLQVQTRRSVRRRLQGRVAPPRTSERFG